MGKAGRLLVASVTLLAANACTFAVPTDPTTFEPGVEHLPEPGRVAIRGDPEAATEDLLIQYTTPDGGVSAQSDAIETGAVIEGGAWDNPGRLRLIVNGVLCDGSFPIVGGRLTEVTLRIGSAGCESIVTNITPLPDG